ncbi:6-phosphofructokinase II, partial [Salmonella enterica subsp. enterica serovar Rubislaw]
RGIIVSPSPRGKPENRLTGGASAAVKNTVAPNEVNDGQWRYYPLCYYRNLP